MRLSTRSCRSVRLSATVCIVAVMLLATSLPAAAITNGVPDTENRYPYVGLVVDFSTGRFCSGALISPTLFLTAAHCFTQPGQTVFVTVAQNASPGPVLPPFIPGQWYPEPTFCSPCGSGLPRFDTHDVAVVVLSAPITVSRYAQLPTSGLADTLGPHSPIMVVGYGVQDFIRGGGPPQPVTNFTRYYAPSLVLRTQSRFSEEFLRVTANPGQGRGGTCFGDSGSPILRADVILGLVSFGTNNNCAGIGYAYRIDTADALAFIATRR
jgi:hypothetical protein